MRVTSDKNCYCHTCQKAFHYMGIARHRSWHRDEKEECTIEYTSGKTWVYRYSSEFKLKEKK